MSRPVQPSDIYRAFTWPHLIVIAKILTDARRWVAADAKPEMGDIAVVIGLRAWAHSYFAVVKAAAKEYRDWLSVTDGSSHFTFKLEMMPIRFCRADSEKLLPESYRTPDTKEREQIEIAFTESGQDAVEGIFRFVVEADKAGYPLGVYLVHANLLGETVTTWRVPVAEDGTGVAPIVVGQKPVILPEIEVLSEEDAAERDRIARDKAERAQAEKEKRESDDNRKRGA
jgi:hypothetical protein